MASPARKGDSRWLGSAWLISREQNSAELQDLLLTSVLRSIVLILRAMSSLVRPISSPSGSTSTQASRVALGIQIQESAMNRMARGMSVAFGISAFAGLAFGQWSSDASVNFAIGNRSGEQNQAKVRALCDGSCYVSWYDNST